MRVTKMDAFTTPSVRRGGARSSHSAALPVPAVVQGAFSKTGLGKILANFETDDYVLAGIIAVLIFEGCDDYILLAALGYLFIMGLEIK